jgi:L-rhamnose mutarotase
MCKLAPRSHRSDKEISFLREPSNLVGWFLFNKGFAMKRLGMTLRLKPGTADSYRKYHESVWPEVLDMIGQCNIRNYSIYFKGDVLFSYFEYHGTDMKKDWAKMAAHQRTQQWWAIMQPMQDPLPTRKDGEWWAEMDEVFHMD